MEVSKFAPRPAVNSFKTEEEIKYNIWVAC